MQFLDSFTLATERQELDVLMGSILLEMSTYNLNSAYPFKIFPFKGLTRIDFAPITVFYGGNGSGKSTLLNIIAEKLRLRRTAPFNDSHMMQEYLQFCRYELSFTCRTLPRESEIITSDGVFDLLLDIRAVNRGVDRRREDLFREYSETRADCTQNGYQLHSLDDYDELKRRNEVRRSTKNAFAKSRMSVVEQPTHSNGESAYGYFTERIKENALYLLDEPENSLSASLQAKLANFLNDSVRFYGCQLIISTHSPFLLSLPGAKIYDLDARPVAPRAWTELENVRAYYELFEKHAAEFH